MKYALVILFVLSAISAHAQTPVNPTTLVFDHSDYAATDSYSVGYFSSATATSPVQEATFVKPATCVPCTGLLPSRPSTFQTWYVGVRAVAGQTSSAWSTPLVPFVRAPSAPSGVRVQ